MLRACSHQTGALAQRPVWSNTEYRIGAERRRVCQRRRGRCGCRQRGPRSGCGSVLQRLCVARRHTSQGCAAVRCRGALLHHPVSHAGSQDDGRGEGHRSDGPPRPDNASDASRHSTPVAAVVSEISVDIGHAEGKERIVIFRHRREAERLCSKTARHLIGQDDGASNRLLNRRRVCDCCLDGVPVDLVGAGWVVAALPREKNSLDECPHQFERADLERWSRGVRSSATEQSLKRIVTVEGGRTGGSLRISPVRRACGSDIQGANSPSVACGANAPRRVGCSRSEGAGRAGSSVGRSLARPPESALSSGRPVP